MAVQLTQFEWLFKLGLVLAFLDGYGIGANDVANSFSTSVSSGSLKLWQACFIACFTEFGGAVLVGANTASTIRNSIVKASLYKANPSLLMLTMVCALVGSSFWTIVASRLGLPVSTSHSIVGGIIGAAWAVFGPKVVVWKWTGFGKIATAWFTSPAISGAVGALIFLSIKFIVLERKNSFDMGIKVIPLYFGLTAIINTFFIVYKGAPGTKLANLAVWKVILIVLGVTAFVILFCVLFFAPYLRRKIVGKENLKPWHIFMMPFLKTQPLVEEAEGAAIEEGTSRLADDAEAAQKLSVFEKVKKTILLPLTADVVTPKTAHVQAMHDRAKKYDVNTEILFSFLQVVTACLASFAHGSNDVANAAGPLATITYIFRNSAIPASKAPVPVWILAYGGAAIDAGLLTMGWFVFRSLGNQITYHSPSRGFSMELATSLTVLSASKLGIPVSTTQCITGATIGVGIAGNNLSGINWGKAAIIFSSWLITVPMTATVSGLIMYFASHAPKILV